MLHLFFKLYVICCNSCVLVRVLFQNEIFRKKMPSLTCSLHVLSKFEKKGPYHTFSKFPCSYFKVNPKPGTENKVSFPYHDTQGERDS